MWRAVGSVPSWRCPCRLSRAGRHLAQRDMAQGQRRVGRAQRQGVLRREPRLAILVVVARARAISPRAPPATPDRRAAECRRRPPGAVLCASFCTSFRSGLLIHDKTANGVAGARVPVGRLHEVRHDVVVPCIPPGVMVRQRRRRTGVAACRPMPRRIPRAHGRAGGGLGLPPRRPGRGRRTRSSPRSRGLCLRAAPGPMEGLARNARTGTASAGPVPTRMHAGDRSPGPCRAGKRTVDATVVQPLPIPGRHAARQIRLLQWRRPDHC